MYDPAYTSNFDPGHQLRLVHGDITLSDADAIVNAANASLQHGGGVAAAILRRGGAVIQRESNAWIREHGEVLAEKPAVTSAGELSAQYVIHAVGPVWGEGDEVEKLASAVYHSARVASELHLNSIAMPAISTGIFGFPLKLASDVILETLVRFVSEHPETSIEQIDLVLFSEEDLATFAETLQRMRVE